MGRPRKYASKEEKKAADTTRKRLYRANLSEVERERKRKVSTFRSRLIRENRSEEQKKKQREADTYRRRLARENRSEEQKDKDREANRAAKRRLRKSQNEEREMRQQWEEKIQQDGDKDQQIERRDAATSTEDIAILRGDGEIYSYGVINYFHYARSCLWTPTANCFPQYCQKDNPQFVTTDIANYPVKSEYPKNTMDVFVVKEEIEDPSYTNQDLEESGTAIDSVNVATVKEENDTFPVYEEEENFNNIKKIPKPVEPTCIVCQETFGNKVKLGRHMRTHPADGTYLCIYCNTNWVGIERLKRHVLIHRDDRPFYCSVCNKPFYQTAKLKIHMRTHTGEQPYTCSVCKKQFSLRLSLIRHMSIHSGAKPFSCCHCSRSFSVKDNLKRHIGIHLGEKPHLCPVCQRPFRSKDDLKHHVRTHSVERPPPCPVCKKRFRRTETFTKHLLIHTDKSVKLQCRLCDKSFTHARSLRRHSSAHTGEKQYPCFHCGEPFLSVADLKKHLLVHSSENDLATPEVSVELVSIKEENCFDFVESKSCISGNDLYDSQVTVEESCSGKIFNEKTVLATNAKPFSNFSVRKDLFVENSNENGGVASNVSKCDHTGKNCPVRVENAEHFCIKIENTDFNETSEINSNCLQTAVAVSMDSENLRCVENVSINSCISPGEIKKEEIGGSHLENSATDRLLTETNQPFPLVDNRTHTVVYPTCKSNSVQSVI